jgi:hypothetical protein
MKIKWNEVTWYSKLIALVIFVALPFIGFYYGVQYGKIVGAVDQASTPSVTSTTSTTGAADATAAYYNNTAEWQTDANNTAGGFSIAYPIDFDYSDNNLATPSTDWRVNANNVSGIKYFTLTVPRAFEPQTNFGGATLTVGADESGGSATATSSATINGVAFTIFTSSDAGAGNYYETTSYRTLHGEKCYAVEYTIHSTQVENYPSSYNLQSFDEKKIDSLMQNVIQTFKFQ